MIELLRKQITRYPKELVPYVTDQSNLEKIKVEQLVFKSKEIPWETI